MNLSRLYSFQNFKSVSIPNKINYKNNRIS